MPSALAPPASARCWTRRTCRAGCTSTSPGTRRRCGNDSARPLLNDSPRSVTNAAPTSTWPGDTDDRQRQLPTGGRASVLQQELARVDQRPQQPLQALLLRRRLLQVLLARLQLRRAGRPAQRDEEQLLDLLRVRPGRFRHAGGGAAGVAD